MPLTRNPKYFCDWQFGTEKHSSRLHVLLGQLITTHKTNAAPAYRNKLTMLLM